MPSAGCAVVDRRHITNISPYFDIEFLRVKNFLILVEYNKSIIFKIMYSDDSVQYSMNVNLMYINVVWE